MANIQFTPVDHDPFSHDIDWSHFNQPFGSVTSNAPTPSERFGDAAKSVLMAAGARPYVANHLVDGLGDVLAMTPAAAPVYAADLIDAKNRGDIGAAVRAAIGMIPGANLEEHLLENVIKLVPVEHDPFFEQMPTSFDIPSTVERIAKMAEDLGFSVRRDISNSLPPRGGAISQYLQLSHPALDDDLKIRIADHSLPPSYGNSANIEVGPHGESVGGWADAVAALAHKLGMPIPDEAATQLAADSAARDRAAAVEKDRSSAYQANMKAKQEALANAESSPNAARIAELQERLKDPSITGNQRKKLNAKLRAALGYRSDVGK